MSWLSKILLIFLSILLILFAFEFLLRNFANPQRIYDVWFDPDMNEKRFQWQFVHNHEDRPLKFENFDSNLGWDSNESGIRGDNKYQLNKSPKTLRILFVGDSFIYGSEVGDQETIAHITGERMIDVETINMGVGGYGIDQSYLKLMSKGLVYRPDIIVFGIHPPNYERSSLSFFSAPKPKFIYDEIGNFKLSNHPVPAPSINLSGEILKDLQKESLLLGLFEKVAKTRTSLFREPLKAAFLKEMDAIVLEIMEESKVASRSINARLIFLQIPHGNKFRDTATRASLAQDYPIDQHLIELYEKAEVPHIDLDKAFLETKQITDIFSDYYTHPNFAKNVGHLSVEGNLAAAQILVSKLCLDLLNKEQASKHCSKE